MKLMICGHGRHGKDTVADMISENLNLRACSSSALALEKVIYPNRYELFSSAKLKSLPDSTEEQKEALFLSRHEGRGREVWYNAISDYNSSDACRLMKELYQRADIYVGCRSLREFREGQESKLFDLSIWVDASERLRTSETTCGVEPFDCDITIENNSSLDDLATRVGRLTRLLKQSLLTN